MQGHMHSQPGGGAKLLNTLYGQPFEVCPDSKCKHNTFIFT